MMDSVCILDNVQFIVMDSVWHSGWYPFTNSGSPIPKSGLSRLLDPISASSPMGQGAGITMVLNRYRMGHIVQYCTLNQLPTPYPCRIWVHTTIEVQLLHKTTGCYKPGVIHSHGFCDLRRTVELISYSKNKWTCLVTGSHMAWPDGLAIWS